MYEIARRRWGKGELRNKMGEARKNRRTDEERERGEEREL